MGSTRNGKNLPPSEDKQKILVKFDFGLNRFIQELHALDLNRKFARRLNMGKMLSSR